MTLKSVNVLAIMGKLCGPIVKVLLKLLKATKVLKFGLAGASVIAYSYMFTWQFALIILGFLFVHEYGHIWAMKRCGLKTKGIYFIPFLGAAAVSDSEFPTYKSEVFIALMGPLVGLLPALVFSWIYWTTKINFFGGAALWMFTVTAFNLLPIMPLDGGRVFRCVALSITSWGGIALYAVGIVILCFLIKHIGLGLVLFCMIIGGIEVVLEFINMFLKKKRESQAVEEVTNRIINEHSHKLDDFSIAIFSQKNPRQFVRKTLIEGVEEEKKKRLKLKLPLSPKLIAGSFTGMGLIALCSIVFVYIFNSIPGAEMALKLLEK
jgi:Zn-dependent protease